jgi:uncharacterized membrane protein
MDRRGWDLAGLAAVSFVAVCLAWAHDDNVFIAVFAFATVIAVLGLRKADRA